MSAPESPVTAVSVEPSKLGRILEQLSGEPFTWLYLGRNIADFKRIQQELTGSNKYLDTTLEFHRTSESLRRPFLEYLYEIGQSLDSLSWWINPVSGRSSYTSDIFRQACYLKLALNLVEDWNGPGRLVIFADEPLCLALRQNLPNSRKCQIRTTRRIRIFPFPLVRDLTVMLAHRVYFVLRETQRIIQSRRLAPHPFVSNEPTTLLICWLTRTNMGDGAEFHRSFFGDLATKLAEFGNQTAVVPFVLRDVPYTASIQPLKDQPLPMVLMHRQLRFVDVMGTAIRSCSPPIRPQTIPEFFGMAIETFVRKELRTYWLTNWAADTLLMTAVVRRWAQQDLSIKRIIYVYENQPWERALCWQARQSLPEAELVGYQHARAPRLALNWYLATGEENQAPLPNSVVTVGEHTAKLFKADGYSSINVRTGGAIQLQDLLKKRSTAGQPAQTNPNLTVLVATSNGLEEAAELVDLASHIFDEDTGVEVILKCHPLMPYQKIENVLEAGLPGYFRISELPISELMLQSSILIYSGSTVAVQAMSLGLPLIYLRTQFDLDLDPLDAVPDLRLEAVGLESLREQVRWLLDNRDEYISQHKNEWEQFAKEFYGPVTEDSYRAFLEPSISLSGSHAKEE